MPITFFDNAYFLQSIGWGIANSIWQAGALCLVYLAITASDKKLSALVKYHLSLLLFFLSFIWFVFTVMQDYQLLLHAKFVYTKKFEVKLQLLNTALPFLAIIYFAMLALYVIKFFRQYLKLRFVSTRNLLKVPVDIRIFTNKTALHLGIKKKVEVWLSAHVEVPSVTGFIKPIILLPAAVINNLTIEQVNAILLHELAHIKRNDYLLNFLQSIIGMILFFNPFALLLSKEAKKERENCCDDWVLNYQFNQVEYAKALLVLEEQRFQQIQLALAATNNKKILLHRIKRILKNKTPEISISFLQKFKFAGFCLALFTLMFLQVPTHSNYLSYKNKTVVDINKTLSIPAQTVLINAPGIHENYSKIIFNKISPQLPSNKTKKTSSPPAKKRASTNTEADYVLAMINEDELLAKNKSDKTIVASISNKEKDSLRSVFVKVDEEQSGKKQINTYYFQLKDDNGKTDIKPLLILKKYKAKEQNDSSKKLPGTKIVEGKKRIST